MTQNRPPSRPTGKGGSRNTGGPRKPRVSRDGPKSGDEPKAKPLRVRADGSIAKRGGIKGPVEQGAAAKPRAESPARAERPARDGKPSGKPKPSPAERQPNRATRRGAARHAAPAPAPISISDRADGLARIAKLLARAGVASRRDIERMIGEGRVALNGAVVETPATLLASLKGVTVDGNPVAAPEPTRLFLYHKPAGLLTAARDPKRRPTIYDQLPPELPRVMPIGRLDLNTEGLLLLTTDGAFKRRMELPATGIERCYRARTYGTVTQAMLETLIEGITIDGIRYGRIDANLERSSGRNKWIELTLTEGKNREVRRVLEHLGLQVSRLIRTRYGPFVLADLAAGGVVEVTARDLDRFLATLK